MSFELGESKANEDMFYERKAPPDRNEDYTGEMVAHKDLFETISEAHYLPELSGPHDEALLESLVEKGCEDNQILGQTLDKLAHLVHGSSEYADEEDDMLLNSAPVTDIITRLEHTLESPGQSSITAAQGLLHLHHIGDHLPQNDHLPSEEESYMTDQVYVSEETEQNGMKALAAATEMQEEEETARMEYEQNIEKKLENNDTVGETTYTESASDSTDTYEEAKTYEESQMQSLPDQSEMIASEMQNDDLCTQICDPIEPKIEENSQEGNYEDNKDDSSVPPIDTDFIKEDREALSSNEDIGPTDLSIKHVDQNVNCNILASDMETSNTEDNMSVKSDEQPKDLTVHRRLPTPHASPRRTDIPRAPSRESDAMQSPQPSGIPAIPSSPEIFSMPLSKSKQTVFLESLLSSPSPKMYTSEVTITKQQCEPLNLGKHRKSASPTVSSCSDEMKKMNKEYGEPQEKKSRHESTDDLAKISKVYNKCSEEQPSKKDRNQERREVNSSKSSEETSPLKQFQMLKTSPDFNIPDPLLIPKDKLNIILQNPVREIPGLLIQRPELRLPQVFAFPSVLQDPDILVISLAQLESILANEGKVETVAKSKELKQTPTPKTPANAEKTTTPQPDQTSQPKPIPSMDALAGDIDAATSAALNQMMWLPYFSQLEAMAACSQNMDFLKALNSSGYTGSNYPDMSQMFNPSNRFMGPQGFPMMPPMDYDNRLQFAMWQEAMSHANASSSQRSKTTVNEQMKELSKSSDVQNPYVHSTKNHQGKTHSSARTSPIVPNYNQRSSAHNPFLQNMYPGTNPNIRPNMPLPGLQIPYFNPQMMGNQRSSRTGQQKSPTSPYYPNNNYLQSAKQSEAQHQQRSGSQESPRPRISVKSLQNLLEPSAAAASGVGSSRRSSTTPTGAMGRRRDEPEVGSTTPLGEPPPMMPPHGHDPSSFHLWHPLFGNQKSYNSPWNWTTVTATGD